MCWSSGLVMGRTCRSSLSASDLDTSMVCEQGAFVASKRRAPPCSETGLERPEATKLAPHMSLFPRQSPKCTTSKLGGRACKRFLKYSSKDRFHGENCNKKGFSCDHRGAHGCAHTSKSALNCAAVARRRHRLRPCLKLTASLTFDAAPR